MSEISRSALFGKLNKIAYQSVESATVFCKMRGNPYVEVVHWIQQVLQLPDSDLHRIVRVSRLIRQFWCEISHQLWTVYQEAQPQLATFLRILRKCRAWLGVWQLDAQ